MGGKPVEKGDNGVPGPGNYNADPSITKDKSIAYKLPSSPQRSDFVSKEQRDLPGPGNYDKHDEFGKNVKSF
jgi:hypothetical protein